MDNLNPKQPVAGFCPNCGAPTQPGGAFCGNCGTKLVAPEPEQPVNEPIAQPTFEPEPPAVQPVAEPQQPTFEPAQPVTQPASEPAAQPYMPEAAQPAFGAQPSMPQQPFGAQPGMPQQPDQPFGAAPVPPMNNFQQPKQPGGVGALVCGVLAILFGLLSPLIGVILGIVAIVLAKKGGDKAKIGRICGIAGIVVSAVMFVIGMVIGMAAIDEIIDDNLDSPSSSISTSDNSGAIAGSNSQFEIDSDLYLDAESMAVAEDVASRFNDIKVGNTGVLADIAAIADEGFYSELEFHMADCGFTPEDYASGMVEGFDYEVDNVILNAEDGTGWVSVTVDAKDVFKVLELFNTKIDNFDASGKASSMTEAEIKAELGKMLSDSVNEAPVTDDVNYAMIDVNYVNGEWVIDEDSWQFELDYMFGLV